MLPVRVRTCVGQGKYSAHAAHPPPARLPPRSVVDTAVTFALNERVSWAVTAQRFLKQDKLLGSEEGCMCVFGILGGRRAEGGYCHARCLAGVRSPPTPQSRPRADMANCATRGPASCPLAACYPCHAGGLAAVTASYGDADGDWLGGAKKEAANYIHAFDVRSQGVRAGISLLLVVINNVLAALLQVLVGFEKHWTVRRRARVCWRLLTLGSSLCFAPEPCKCTRKPRTRAAGPQQSDKERAYAVAAFVSQVLNSVMVLLLVNAQARSRHSVFLCTLAPQPVRTLILSSSPPNTHTHTCTRTPLPPRSTPRRLRSTPASPLLTAVAAAAGSRTSSSRAPSGISPLAGGPCC